MNLYLDELGAPHIEVAGLKLWVHSYRYRDAKDYDDANWLNATAICSGNGASVLVRGAFIRTDDILAWGRAVEDMATRQVGEARLACMEPELAVSLKSRSLGAVEMEVEITPDQLTQEHRFKFAIDQSYLGQIASQCAGVLDRFPVRSA